MGNILSRNTKKTFGDKMRSYLERNPVNCDIIFCVGPQKTEVKALKLALKAVSPEMEKLFKEKWDTAIAKEGEGHGIALPHLDPYAFEVFLQLLFVDDLSCEDVESMKFPFEVLFNLIKIAREFKMLELENTIHSATAEFFKEFRTFVQSKAFLKVPREILQTMLSSDLIPVGEVQVVNAACRWAQAKCLKMKSELTGKNMRLVLGDALFQIRFPLMSNRELVNFVSPKYILTRKEELEVFKYISLTGNNKKKFGLPSDSPFCSRVRKHKFVVESKIIEFFKNIKVLDEPPFICNSSPNQMLLQVNQRILVESVGFLGPIEADSAYEVSVEIFKCIKSGSLSVGKTIQKIKAERKTVFHIFFDHPIILDATYRNDSFTQEDGCYLIQFSLKGLNTQSAIIPKSRTGETGSRSEASGVAFYCRWNSSQLAELRFKVFN